MLSLWDSLRSSTQEGRIVTGWPMRQGETLYPWKSRDKKCCLYETPYVAAPIWILGDIIAKFSALRATSYRCTYKSQVFFGSQVTHFWRDPSHHIKTPTWNFYKEVYEPKWYQIGLLIALLENPMKSTFKCLFKHTPLWHVIMSKMHQEPWRSRWPQERDAERSTPTHVCHTHCTSRQLSTTAYQRCDVPWDWLRDTCQMARVHWGTRCKGFCSKGGLHYQIE